MRLAAVKYGGDETYRQEIAETLRISAATKF
jgi:hypothetical protein